MATLKLRSLGRIEVLSDGIPLKWGAESAQDLVFLLLAHSTGRSREEIIDDLWQEDGNPRSNNRFRVALHRARAALGGKDQILETDGRYQLSDAVLQASDLFEMYALLQQAEHTRGDAQIFELNRAIALYTGDFLPHCKSDWAEEAREQHRAAYLRARIERSILYCEHLQCDLAVQDLAAALRADPYLSENYHQKLMACLSVVKDKYAAAEHYRRFVHFLQDDLGDTPMDETRELAEHLKAGERICQRQHPVDQLVTHSCPLTSDGQCPSHFAALLHLT